MGLWRMLLCVTLLHPLAVAATQHIMADVQAEGETHQPIVLMGVLASSPPLAPHWASWSSLVACGKIVTWSADGTPKKRSCSRGGFPAIAAWMRATAVGSRGTIKILSPDFRSRTVRAHPMGLAINYEAWERLGLDVVTLRNEYLMTSRQKPGASAASFIENSKRPFLQSDMIITEVYASLYGLFVDVFMKQVDDVLIGVLVIWSERLGSRMERSFPHGDLLPVLTARLRKRGVVQIVVLRIGHTTGSAREEMVELTGHDIDVVLYDGGKLKEAGTEERLASFRKNGTAIIVAEEYVGGDAYPFVALSLVQSKASQTWSYTLKEAVPHSTLPPGIDVGPDSAYMEDLIWAQRQVDATRDNDYVVATSLEMMPSSHAWGTLPCREGECELGRMTADAFLHQMQTDVALVNAGSVRGYGWDAGNITISHLWQTFPFANTLCRVNVSGTVLLSILNHGASNLLPTGRYNKSTKLGLFAQVGGVRYGINPTLDVPLRVFSPEVLDTASGEYREIERRRHYSVALSSFLAGGGDNYAMFNPDTRTYQEGSLDCTLTTVLEATEAYLQHMGEYTPFLSGAIWMNDTEAALILQNKTRDNCTKYQRYNAYWEDCVDCPPGFWHPEPDTEFCVEDVKDGENNTILVVVLAVLGGVVLLILIPIAWKMTEKQRRINALFNNNKIAEECAIAVMDLRLGDLDYLHELEKPNTIQSAFIAITKQMKVYMEFMPKNLIANCQVTSDSDSAESESSHASHTSVHSKSSNSLQNRGRHATLRLTTMFIKTKHITALALNSKGHLYNIRGDVVAKHSNFIEQFAEAITLNKGIAETLSGDRMLATWNTVTETVNQAMHSCKAALALQKALENTMYIGIAKGSALFGLFGGEGTKRYDVLGNVIPSASLLMVLNKQYNSSILVSPEVENEGNLFYYYKIMDYVCYRKLGAACFVCQLTSAKDISGEEWMYTLELAEGKDPWLGLNTAWHDFIQQGSIPKGNGVELSGILAELYEKKHKGEYVAESAPLDLM